MSEAFDLLEVLHHQSPGLAIEKRCQLIRAGEPQLILGEGTGPKQLPDSFFNTKVAKQAKDFKWNPWLAWRPWCSIPFTEIGMLLWTKSSPKQVRQRDVKIGLADQIEEVPLAKLVGGSMDMADLHPATRTSDLRNFLRR